MTEGEGPKHSTVLILRPESRTGRWGSLVRIGISSGRPKESSTDPTTTTYCDDLFKPLTRFVLTEL